MADDGLAAALAAAEALLRSGREEAALIDLGALVARHPLAPRAHFALAGALDFAGRSAEAVAPYRQAMALGLSGAEVPRWYVQLGSTLRNVGAPTEAVRLLTEGADRFPDDASIRIFRALALHDAGRDRDALVALLDLLLAHADGIDLRYYGRAIRSYTEALRAEPGPTAG